MPQGQHTGSWLGSALCWPSSWNCAICLDNQVGCSCNEEKALLWPGVTSKWWETLQSSGSSRISPQLTWSKPVTICRALYVVNCLRRKSFSLVRWAFSRVLGCENGSPRLCYGTPGISSLTVTPGLSTLHWQTGFWRQVGCGLGCFRFAGRSWSPGLDQITALGIGGVASSLLCFSNMLEVGFSYNGWTESKQIVTILWDWRIPRVNASLQKYWLSSVDRVFHRPLNMVTSPHHLQCCWFLVTVPFIWEGRRDRIAPIWNITDLTVFLWFCSFSWIEFSVSSVALTGCQNCEMVNFPQYFLCFVEVNH